MNIDDALDNPAGAASINWVKSLVIPLIVATVGGTIALGIGASVFQRAAKSNQTALESQRVVASQQAVSVEKLVKTYNSFSAITPAGSVFAMTSDEKRDLEYAMRDVYLYGNDEVRVAVDKWFKSKFKTPVEGVLLPLRNQIRDLSGLEPSKQTTSPWIQTYWRNPAAATSAPDTTVAE
jgi:hypothetical protein